VATCPSGHQNPAANRFCSECGAPLIPTQSPPTSIEANENLASALTIGVSLLAIFGVVALIFFILAMVGAGDLNSRGTANSYFVFAGWGAVPWLAASAALLIGAGWLWQRLQHMRPR
jgi:hypothetical protein